MFCKQVPVLGRTSRRKLSLNGWFLPFLEEVCGEKHDLGKDGKGAWAGFTDRDSVFRGGYPETGHLGRLLSLELEPGGLLALEATPRKPCQPRRARNRLEKAGMEQIGCSSETADARRTLPSNLVLDTRSKENRSGPDDGLWEW